MKITVGSAIIAALVLPTVLCSGSSTTATNYAALTNLLASVAGTALAANPSLTTQFQTFLTLNNVQNPTAADAQMFAASLGLIQNAINNPSSIASTAESVVANSGGNITSTVNTIESAISAGVSGNTVGAVAIGATVGIGLVEDAEEAEAETGCCTGGNCCSGGCKSFWQRACPCLQVFFRYACGCQQLPSTLGAATTPANNPTIGTIEQALITTANSQASTIPTGNPINSGTQQSTSSSVLPLMALAPVSNLATPPLPPSSSPGTTLAAKKPQLIIF